MRRRAAWALLGLTLAACAASSGMSTWRALEPGPAYESALDKATRRVEHIEDLDLHSYVTGTLVTAAFVRAYEAEYAEVYGAGAKPWNLSLDGERTLILALASNDREANDLPAFGRLWNLTYADGVTTVAPRRIERMDRDALFMRYFFPYWSPWQQIYRVSFPLPASETTGGTVELKGIGGHIRLNW